MNSEKVLEELTKYSKTIFEKLSNKDQVKLGGLGGGFYALGKYGKKKAIEKAESSSSLANAENMSLRKGVKYAVNHIKDEVTKRITN